MAKQVNVRFIFIEWTSATQRLNTEVTLSVFADYVNRQLRCYSNMSMLGYVLFLKTAPKWTKESIDANDPQQTLKKK